MNEKKILEETGPETVECLRSLLDIIIKIQLIIDDHQKFHLDKLTLESRGKTSHDLGNL